MSVTLQRYTKGSIPHDLNKSRPASDDLLLGWLKGISRSNLLAESQGSLRESFLALPKEQRQLLHKKLGDHSLQTIFSLAAESDPRIFTQRFFNLGQSFIAQGRIDLAISVFQAIVGATPRGRPSPQATIGNRATTWGSPLQDTKIIQQAKHQLEIIQGTAPIFSQTEYVTSQTFQSLKHPAPWLGFGVAMPLFKVGKAISLPFLLSGTGRGLVTTQLGATVASGLFGFSLEASSFAIATKLGHHLAGTNTDGKILPTASEFLSSATMLTMMKGAGGVANLLVGAHGGAPLQKIYQTTVLQASNFGGLLMAHGIETHIGLRDPQPFNKTIAESFATLGQFWVMGQVSPWMLGKGIQNYLQKLDVQTKNTLLKGSSWGFKLPYAGLQESLVFANQSHSQEKIQEGLVNTKWGENNIASVQAVAESTLLSTQKTFRVIKTSKGKEFNYQLILEDLATILKPGRHSVIAKRDGREIKVKIEYQFESSPEIEFFFDEGTAYYLTLQEGALKGEAKINFIGDKVQLGWISTAKMPAGSGSIFLDWLVTQMAMQGKRFEIVAGYNYHLIEILKRGRLIDIENAELAACDYRDAWEVGGYRVVMQGKLADPEYFQRVQEFPYYNVSGTPNPELIANIKINSDLSCASCKEVNSNGLKSLISGSVGESVAIGKRDGEKIQLTLKDRRSVNMEGFFFDGQVTQLDLVLSEGNARDSIKLFLQPGILSLYSVNARGEEAAPFRPGAGSIFLKWLATQAAIHHLKFNTLQIINPRILNILLDQQLVLPDVSEVEACLWSSTKEKPFTVEKKFSLGDRESMRRYRYFDFHNVRGKPNPALISSIEKRQ